MDLPKTITLTPTSGNRTFTFDVGADTDGDGENDCDCIGLTVNVVGVDVRVDSNNDGQIDGSDDEIEANAPGKVLALNNDTDNGDANMPDYQLPGGPVSREDDLVPAYLSVLGAPEDEGRWSLSFSSHVRVYLSANKSGLVAANDWAPRSTMPSVVYVEGISQSGSAGDAWISLSYQLPDLPTTVISDTAVLTVATVVITDVALPNDFLGTLDEDPNRDHWAYGIRQEAETTIRVEYGIRPEMAWSCDSTCLRLCYTGKMCQEVGGPLVDVYGSIFAGGQMPPAQGDVDEVAFPNVVIPPVCDGIQTTAGGGRYELVLECCKDSLTFRSEPYGVTAKPLVYGFHPSVETFCPYTHRHRCPNEPYYTVGRGDSYWGTKFMFGLSATLVGSTVPQGSTWDEVFRGGFTGLEIFVEGAEANKQLRVLWAQKRRSTGAIRSVKWEGYDSSIDEPAGEPFFWGPTDPSRTSDINIYNYAEDPNYVSVVPQHVVRETTNDGPYRVRFTATAEVMSPPYPEGCRCVYKRWGVPVWVAYDREVGETVVDE